MGNENRKIYRPLLATDEDLTFSKLIRTNSDVPQSRPQSKTLLRTKSDTNSDSFLRSKYFGSTVSLHDTDDTLTKV